MKNLPLKHLPSNQQGAALYVSLIMLIILTIIGLSAAQRSNLQERMAANLHIQNIAFNAAESAIGGFMREANTGNKSADGHILKVLYTSDVQNQCYDQSGVRGDCTDTNYLDADKASMVKAQLEVTQTHLCNQIACSGYSIGRSGSTGCRIFRVNATGTVGTTVSEHTLWAYELNPCD